MVRPWAWHTHYQRQWPQRLLRAPAGTACRTKHYGKRTGAGQSALDALEESYRLAANGRRTPSSSPGHRARWPVDSKLFAIEASRGTFREPTCERTGSHAPYGHTPHDERLVEEVFCELLRPNGVLRNAPGMGAVPLVAAGGGSWWWQLVVAAGGGSWWWQLVVPESVMILPATGTNRQS